jgi:hypothetical protein
LRAIDAGANKVNADAIFAARIDNDLQGIPTAMGLSGAMGFDWGQFAKDY